MGCGLARAHSLFTHSQHKQATNGHIERVQPTLAIEIRTGNLWSTNNVKGDMKIILTGL